MSQRHQTRSDARGPAAQVSSRDEVVDVEQLEFDRRVADMNRKSIGNVVAESGYGRVIVGTAPLTEEVRETVYKYFRAGFRSIVEEKFFSGLLAFAIWMAGIATYQSSLNGAAQHYGHVLPCLRSVSKQCRGKAEVAFGGSLRDSRDGSHRRD